MRVHLYPAGRDQEARGVNLAPGRSRLAADLNNPAAPIATSPVKAAWPVPSMMVSPRMTMSCMETAPTLGPQMIMRRPLGVAQWRIGLVHRAAFRSFFTNSTSLDTPADI